MQTQAKPLTRNWGIDVLRIVAMIMVVILHTLSKSKLLDSTQVLGLKYELSWLLKIICYCAVDCFVLISGYVGLNSRFKLSRVVLLWVEVAFYSFFFEALFQIIKSSFDFKALVVSLFPVITREYWFFTAYFVLSLFMPFINKLVKELSLNQCGFLCAVILLFFSLVPVLIKSPISIIDNPQEDLFFLNRGYSLLWMGCTYIFGCVIKKADEQGIINRIKPALALAINLLSIALMWLIKYLCESRAESISASFILCYNSPLVIFQAVALFILFFKMKIPSAVQGVISFFASGAFAVYIIHINPHIFKVFEKQVLPIFDMPTFTAILAVLFCGVFVFFVCSLADAIRQRLFKAVKINALVKKLDNIGAIKKLDL